MLTRLQSAAPPELLPRLQNWREAATCPPAALINLLLDAHEAQEPWFDAMLLMVIDTSPAKWQRRLEGLRLLRTGLNSTWRAQDCPTLLTDLDLSSLSPTQRAISVEMGWILDRALIKAGAPHHLTAVARALLPGRFLASRGWNNLDHLPARLLALLIERSGSLGSIVPAEHHLLTTLLFSHRQQPWADHVACVAGALMGEQIQRGERNAPLTILNIVKRVANILQVVFTARGLSNMSEFRADADLKAYLRGDYGGPKSSVRSRRVQLYSLAVNAQTRLIKGAPDSARQWQHWLLPEPRNAMDADGMVLKARVGERKRRSEQVAGVMPRYQHLVRLIVHRAQAFQALRIASTAARAEYMSQEAERPVRFSVALPDRSAVLDFQVISVAQLDVEARGKAACTRARPALEGRSLIEYLGARDHRGQQLPGEPYFTSVHRAWYDAEARDAAVLAGNPVSDFVGSFSGMLRPKGRLGQFCRQHLQMSVMNGNPPRPLFDVDALCTGAAVGALLLVLSVATGMRMHELQQIRLDSGYTGVDSEGRIICRLFPKAHKRARSSAIRQVIPAEVQPFWDDFRRVYDLNWPIWRRILPQNGAALGLEAGIYLFQADGIPLKQVDLHRLARFITFGIGLKSATGQPIVLTIHLLRHCYSQRRKQLDHDQTEIQRALSHRDPEMTKIYTGLLQGLAPHPTLQWPTTMWTSLLSEPQ